MKFVIIGPTWPFRGGIAHYTTLLVKHLREKHDVRFISYLKQYPKFLYPGNTDMDPSSASSVLRVDCERILIPWNPLTWWKALKIVKEYQPDGLVLQWWTPFWSPMLFFLTRMIYYYHKPKIKIIFLCHHIMSPDGGILDWFLARRILRRGDAHIVMSEEDFALLRRAMPKATIRGTTHPPYDFFSREPVPKASARDALALPDAPTLLFFGFVRRYKGLGYLIAAMPEVLRMIPNLRLLIVGEFWEDVRPYLDQIRQLGIAETVHVVNKYVPNDQIALYFSAADCVVMPYLEATQSGVGQLAIGFERPMIGTHVGGMPDIVRHGETGLIVPPGDSAALAKAIVQLFSSDDSEAMRLRIRAAKKSASWAPLVESIEELAR